MLAEMTPIRQTFAPDAGAGGGSAARPVTAVSAVRVVAARNSRREEAVGGGMGKSRRRLSPRATETTTHRSADSPAHRARGFRDFRYLRTIACWNTGKLDIDPSA